MRRSALAGLTAVVLTAGTLLGAGAPAQAANSTVLYAGTAGPTTVVAAPGQTVQLAGTYSQPIIIASSGTADQPITIRPAITGATLVGSTVGFVVNGQHDIVIQGFTLNNEVTAPAVDLSNASGITVRNVRATMGSGVTVPAFRLVAVTGSSLIQVSGGGPQLPGGVSLDAASTGDTITSSGFFTNQNATGTGIDVAGSGNSILNNRVSGWAGAGIAVEPGVAYTTIANNEVFGGVGEGIRSSGATRTTITNNTIENRCRDLIRVDGASTGASVQNNIAFGSVADFESFCGASTPGVIDIGVHDGAMADTIVDYNTVYNFRYTLPQVYYAWGDTAVDGNAFRAASGQGAHDYERGDAAFVIDSANSAAPGFQATDAVGHPREDDPGLGNGGVGPISYADRGALEEVKAPTAQLTFTLGPIPGVFIADASASTAGFAPIGSYRFDFGDGIVVTQPNPVCWHRYTRVGTYWLTVTVVSSDGLSGYKLQTVGVRSVVRIWHGTRLNAVVTRSAGSFPAL